MNALAERPPAIEDIAALARVRELTASGRARKLRKAARLSQGDIATALGTTLSAVSRWETGRTRVPRSHAALYSRILDELERQTISPPTNVGPEPASPSPTEIDKPIMAAGRVED